MRIYQDFKEALSEIKRDLAEMGIKIHSQTYQDKYIGDDPEMASRELQNYMYTVVNPQYVTDLEPTLPWADAEFRERIKPMGNPGEAWKLRKDVWEQFIQDDGKFGYHYGERLAWQVEQIVETISKDHDSRQAFMGMWRPDEDLYKTGGVSRVPCTLGYYFQLRKGQLNITYLQRSGDFATHFVNDIYLAGRMHMHILAQLRQAEGYQGDLIEKGTYTHWLGSLHIFERDVKGVF